MGERGLPIASRLSLIDRASHIRTDSAELDRLFLTSRIIEVSAGKIRASEDGIHFAQAIPEGERYFLGLAMSFSRFGKLRATSRHLS